MSFKLAKHATLACIISLFATSCTKNISNDAEIALQKQSSDVFAGKKMDLNLKTSQQIVLNNTSAKIREKALAISKIEDFADYLKKKLSGVSASECSPTEFDNVIDKYVAEFGPLEFDLYGTYVAINQLATLIDESKQYFGAEGENTHLIEKQQQKLESFWDMPDEVAVKGEHNSTLNDRDRIAEVYIIFAGLSPADAYMNADLIIAINKESPVFIESPLVSFDAFSSTDKFIVLGDGILQALTETGIDNDIVASGVLAHEWAHQVQFNNSKTWYGVNANQWPFTSAFTRLTELEADFFASYYLTHKKGATYNWKRVAQFLNLFFNVGDCFFTSPNHHGTPNQRLAASRLGFIIADETQPKGHTINADGLNSVFMAAYNSIINNTITTENALAGLKTPDLKDAYIKVLEHKKELESIMNGKLNKIQVENL